MPAERVDLKTFEATFEELEAIVRKLEGGALSLDESLGQYERGVSALKHCYRVLEEAEKRLEVLVRGDDGAPATRPAELTQLRGEARGEAKLVPQAPAASEARVAEPVKAAAATEVSAAEAPAPKVEKAEKAEKKAAPKKESAGGKSLFG